MSGCITRRFATLIVSFALPGSACFGDDDLLQKGKTIYQNQCAECHGKEGQGVAKRFDKPLLGDATVGELSELITETMPEDDPDLCVGQDATAVATYIHQTFYSKAAQQPRIKLARLTGTQLRQSLADLYAHFAGVAKFSEQPGLHGEYYNGKRPRRDKRKIDRTDATIDFDFADKGPGDGISAEEFSIQWTGGLKIDVTGRYELIIRSTCAFVCFLGSDDREFINNYVQSGDKTEFHRSLVLTAGRIYPVKLQFYQRKRKTKQPPARIALSWVPPYGTEQIVPAGNLLSERVPATFTLQAKLPPDDRSYGYERGISVDRQWDDSTTAAAIEFAEAAADELWPRYRSRNRNAPDQNRAQLRGFLTEMAETAFRGPVDAPIRRLYVDQQVEFSEDDAEAIKRSLLITLKSPRFLYPLLDRHRSASQRAGNRLTLTLHDSLPADAWLIQQIGNDKLKTESEIRAAAQRLLNDRRTRGKTRALMYAWLNLSRNGEAIKDEEAFSGFDADLVSDLRASFDAFLDEIVWSEASDFRQLTRADWTYTNERLHKFYGPAWMPASKGTGMQKSVAAPNQRTGLIAHPYLMSGLAYPDSTSPIHRGVFVIRYLLGRTLRPPNEAFTPLSPDLHPDLTTRERIALQTSPESCQVCHKKINGLGFTLENFDTVGRYRVKEKGREINVKGGYTARSGKYVKIEGSRGLSEYLATSDDAHRAFVDRAFEHFVKQPAAAYGTDTLEKLTKSFQANQFNIQKLLIEIAVVAAKPSDG